MKEIKVVLKNVSTRKILGPDGLPGEFILLKEEISILYKLIQKKKEGNKSRLIVLRSTLP